MTESTNKLDEILELAGLGYDHKDCHEPCSQRNQYSEAHQAIEALIREAVIGELDKIKIYGDGMKTHKYIQDRISVLKGEHGG